MFFALDLFPNSPVKCDVVDEKVGQILGDPSHLYREIEANTRRWSDAKKYALAKYYANVSKNLKQSVLSLTLSTKIPNDFKDKVGIDKN